MKFKSLAFLGIVILFACSLVAGAKEASLIAIDGSVFYDDGSTLVPDGWNVVVKNKTQNLTQSSKTGDAGTGRYSVTFLTFDPAAIVAATGDEIEVVITDADGNSVKINKQESLTYILTDKDLDASSATINAVTDVLVPPMPITKLVVSGTVYYNDGKTPSVGLTVKVLETSLNTNDAGKYDITIEKAGKVIASAGDEIAITVEQEKKEIGKVSRILGAPDEAGSLTIEVNVVTNLTAPPASSSLLAIEGSVFLKDGKSASDGLIVEVKNKTQNLSQSSTTGDAGPGRYSVTFLTFDPDAIVATTGDEIEIVVTDADGNKRARLNYQLATVEVLENKSTANVVFDVTQKLTINGTVYAEDKETPVPEGLAVKVANPFRNLELIKTIAAEGKYSVTLETMEPGKFAAGAGEEIMVTAFDEEGNPIGSQPHILTTAEVVENQITIDLVTTYVTSFSFSRTLVPGLNMISIPLTNSQATTDGGEPVALGKIGDLEMLLGEDTPVYYYNTSEGKYKEAPVEMEITGDLGLVVMLLEGKTITFEGKGWPGEIKLVPGLNMFAAPLNSEQTKTVGDLQMLLGKDAPIYYYDTNEGMFKEAGGNLAIEGGVGYVTMVLNGITLSVDGIPWESEMQAPFISGQLRAFDPTSTPLMAVKGTAINESTGAALNGLSVTVHHLSSGAVITETTDANGQFSAIFMDVFNNQSFRVGDVFKIDISSNNSDIRIESVQYTITQEDIKLGRIILSNLAARIIPKRSQLMQNWPNPFNPETWIPFQLSKAAEVNITIYDIHGRAVRQFDLGYVPAGIYNTKYNAIYWNGTNDAGERVSSGVYFYHIQAGEFSASRKMAILK